MTDELPPALFQRQDNTPDTLFYQQPRLVTHIDDATIAQITEFYREFLPADSDVLDLMSSWISHLPDEVSYRCVIGHGMNAEELKANSRLSDYLVQDLNADPVLPLESGQFDRACLVVSIQYLVKPVEVLSEVLRTLRPGGKLSVAMSHRCFPTKAIAAFHQLPPNDRIALVCEYLQRSGFINVEYLDRSPQGADPLWLVIGERS